MILNFAEVLPALKAIYREHADLKHQGYMISISSFFPCELFSLLTQVRNITERSNLWKCSLWHLYVVVQFVSQTGESKSRDPNTLHCCIKIAGRESCKSLTIMP